MTRPFIAKQDLFEARSHGYRTCRIPAVAATGSDTVLVTAEARTGQGGDFDDSDVLLRRSIDGGKTFGSVVKMVDHRTFGNGPTHNVVMIPDKDDGPVHVLFCHDYARVFSTRSDDDGITFSEPVDITHVFDKFRGEYPWRVCATGPGHGLQLRNGRLIVPVWLSDETGTEMGAGLRGHRPSIVSLIYSDDHGATWRRGEMVCRHGDRVGRVDVVNPSESVAVELSDGRVLFNIRSESRAERRLLAISPDGVTDWDIVGFDDALLEPVCMAAILRYDWPHDNEPGRILFANPRNLENRIIPPGGHLARDRKCLTVQLSEDDGTNWRIARALEAGPAGYSDMARLRDGTILCFYECGRVEHMCDVRYLRLARFNMTWLAGEEDP